MAKEDVQAQGPNTDLAIHTLGWKAFQDLCAQVCTEVLGLTVSIYREAQDGGQDAVFQAQVSTDSQPKEATIQCKFSSKANQRLKPSDIDTELEVVRELVKAGRAHVYYFITSLGVDATVAASIRDKLTASGIREPHVLGKEWLTLQIRNSARLRALVPRVYGLGDLSVILDERCADQTRALLGHMQSGLRVYVPTGAHRRAVRILSDHGLVLLLGPPATGKTMLAAILATTAIDGDNHQSFKCEGPLELLERWNPHERERLYWIDDAFGPNQLRSDYVDSWIGAIPKIKAAIELGNRFILTSRNHIWNAAKYKLGTRNHPLLQDDRAVVDVGALSSEEREQIVYNHIKAGNQLPHWKLLVKPHLRVIANNPQLLPEIARRLGDSSYTKAIRPIYSDLIKFVAEPAEFLKHTILELTEPQQAALTLVFLWRSKLSVQDIASTEIKLVADKYGVAVASTVEALAQLDGAFLSQRQESNHYFWGFFHPTFADAISSILSARPDLVELYIRGTRIETLLSEAVCEGANPIRDAVIVPTSASETLVTRLLNVPDTPEFNGALFDFLVHRSSEIVLRSVLSQRPKILERLSPMPYWGKRYDRRLKLLAVANKLGFLPAELRADVAYELEWAALKGFDASFMDDDEILALMQPTQIVRLTTRLIDLVHDVVPQHIEELAEDADPDDDIPEQFSEIRNFVDQLKNAFDDDAATQKELNELDSKIDLAIEEISHRKSDDDDQGFWHNVSPGKVISTPPQGRSIFSDVDE